MFIEFKVKNHLNCDLPRAKVCFLELNDIIKSKLFQELFYTKNPRKHSAHFAWQIGGGIDIKISEKFSTTISYSYVDKEKLKLINTYYNGDNSMADQTGGSTNVTNKLRAHSVSLALKVNF